MHIFPVFITLAVLSVALATTSSPFWPQPQSWSLGESNLGVSTLFEFKQTQEGQKSQLLQRAIERYHKIYSNYRQGRVSAHTAGEPILDTCNIEVSNIADNAAAEKASLDLGVDESYTMNINADGTCSITSVNVWGAIHALETFSQLLTRTGDNGTNIVMDYAPVQVSNSARFSHRGLLIDTARHFLPIETIKTMIDTLPMANFNVLHWHMEDAESFPLDTPSAPLMDKGAWSPEDIYTMQQVSEIDAYATDRGVRIIYEIDGPGHGSSWGKGYPELIPDGCAAKYSYNIDDLAINPTLSKTYDVLNGILSDIVTATGTKYLHLGGDEVVYGCWETDASIATWMQENNIDTYPDLLGFYVDKAQGIAAKLDTTPIQWEDTFIAGVRPASNTIFDVWTNSTQIAAVTDAGYKVIAAPSDYWYLDHCANTWQVMYNYDPIQGLSSNQAALVIGGEASMWGELVNQYNIQTKVWPTAAAVAERLWSNAADTSPDNIDQAQARLIVFICRMNNRGFFVGPIEPSYCALKYV